MNYGRAFRIALAVRAARATHLAEVLETSPAVISAYLTGRRNPSGDVVTRVAGAVGVPVPVLHALALGVEDYQRLTADDRAQLGDMVLRFITGVRVP